MKYKNILEEVDIRKDEIESGEMLEGNTMSLTIGLDDGVALNLYVKQVAAGNGRKEYIIFCKALDAETGIADLLCDRDAFMEIRKQWPLFYGMLKAGAEDEYDDVVLLGMEQNLVLAAGFDMDCLDYPDAVDYLMAKADMLVDCYLELRDEVSASQLGGYQAAGAYLARSLEDGWQAAAEGSAIGRCLVKVLQRG